MGASGCLWWVVYRRVSGHDDHNPVRIYGRGGDDERGQGKPQTCVRNIWITVSDQDTITGVRLRTTDADDL
jgi:hypothetical protein